MPTSMLDALVVEQERTLRFAIATAQTSIETVRQAGLILQQLREMAAQERAARTYQNLDSPADAPETQDDGQGNQGSDEVAAGDAGTRGIAESEQVVADVAPGEQAQACKDPGAVPDAPKSKKDRILDLYAETDLSGHDAAERVGVTLTTANGYIREARRAGDRRAAQGDLRRTSLVSKVPASEPGRSERREPAPLSLPNVPITDADSEPSRPAAGSVVALDLANCRLSYDACETQVSRLELRIVHILNTGRPTPLGVVLNHTRIVTSRLLANNIDKLNPALERMGLKIVQPALDTWQLVPLSRP